MRTVLVIQRELPNYRNFFWKGIREACNLYLADTSTNRLILPDGSVTSFRKHVFNHPVEYLVLSAGIRDTSDTLRYIKQYRPSKVLGWTQFVGRNKSLLSRIIKSLYLMLFFDKTLLYYDHEKSLIPFASLRKRAVGLNNTIEDFSLSVHSNDDPHTMLFIGRYTKKSKLALLLKAALEVEDLQLHIIGTQVDELPEQFRQKNFHFHGKIDDPIYIQKIAAFCTYFVYPGDVGLSIIHAVKLGLIPIVHADLDAHMPECRAVAQTLPVIYFQKDDQNSLCSILNLLIKTKPTSEVKEWIASRSRKVFAEEVMISNFIKNLEGY